MATRRQHAAAPGGALARLPNLGPASAAMLHAAGITTPEQLRVLGSVAAYDRVRRSGVRVSLNLLWALEGALCGLPWQTVAQEHRTSLLLALDALPPVTGCARAPAPE
ncbi:MAG: TfoX/Sxy family protein [Burkholderiaceae bacterium]